MLYNVYRSQCNRECVDNGKSNRVCLREGKNNAGNWLATLTRGGNDAKSNMEVAGQQMFVWDITMEFAGLQRRFPELTNE